MKRITQLFSLSVLLFCLLGLIPASAAYGEDAARQTPDNGLPYYIMVNRQMNTVTIYTVGEDGNYSSPYKVMVCSTGRLYHATPTGTFAIYGAKSPWTYMVDGTYGQYSSRFYGHYLFHSVCYRSAKPDTLITEEYNLLGSVASLGCVRLQTADAKWIYDNCAAGTLVTIYDSPDPGPLGKPERFLDVITPELDNGWDPTDPDPNNPWKALFSETGYFVTDFSISNPPSDLVSGTTYSLQTNLTASGPVPDIRWSSSDPQVIQVSNSGQLFALNEGTSTITASCGSHQSSITVHVSENLLPFSDLIPGSWYYPFVRYAYERQLLLGTDDGIFSPDGHVTKAQLAQILYKLADSPVLNRNWDSPQLYDVLPADWFRPAAEWVSDHQLFSSSDLHQFSPHSPLTREEVIYALHRYYTVISKQDGSSSQTLTDYSDAHQISAEAFPAMCWAIEHGFLSGTNMKELLPHRFVTRVEIAAILQQFCTALENITPTR